MYLGQSLSTSVCHHHNYRLHRGVVSLVNYAYKFLRYTDEREVQGIDTINMYLMKKMPLKNI